MHFLMDLFNLLIVQQKTKIENLKAFVDVQDFYGEPSPVLIH